VVTARKVVLVDDSLGIVGGAKESASGVKRRKKKSENSNIILCKRVFFGNGVCCTIE